MRKLSAILLALSCLWPGAAHSQDNTTALLQQLSNAAGPSGFEEPVRKKMVNQLRPVTDEITYDGLGSVIARQGDRGPRIMLDAHMDELGGIIRRSTPDGFLTMQMLGGWLDQAIAGQRWTIIGSKGPVRAITSIRDVHLTAADERGKLITRDAVYLDVGAANAAEVTALGISPGDPVVPDSEFAIMNGTQSYAGKAWDDRVGCAVLIAAARRLKASAIPTSYSWWLRFRRKSASEVRELPRRL